MIYPFSFMRETTINYIPKIRGSYQFIYLAILLIIIVTLTSLPFVFVDVSVKTQGISRPVNERTEVKSVISGIIDSILYKEGDKVQKSAVILRIKDLVTKRKKTVNEFEINQRSQFIHDLALLTSNPNVSSILTQLTSPLYRDQASRFVHQKTDQEASLRKANKELEMNTSLAKDKVISRKELFDTQINQEKVQSSYKAFTQEQLSTWQQELARYRMELSQYRQQIEQVNTDASYYDVKAPVSGIIQGINTRYPGGLLQASETLCNISPEETLIGECYVQTKDIGLLTIGQSTRFQFEAFDYNYFGVITGKIISIDNDFTAVDNKAIFKVRCSFDSSKLHLKNGFKGQLKKGLGFQANFVVARRSLWQLLFDKLDDWLNPNAPKTITAAN